MAEFFKLGLDASDAVEVKGGLPDDFDAVISGLVVNHTDYNGKAKNPACVVTVEFDTGDDGPDIYPQFYYIGPASMFFPSVDGETPEEGDDAEGTYVLSTVQNHNMYADWTYFLDCVRNSGAPEELFNGDDLGVLIGQKFHFNRLEQPGRPVYKPKARAVEGEEAPKPRDARVLVPTKHIPAGGKAAKGKAKGKATGKKATGPDVTEAVNAIIVNTLAEAGGGVNKSALVLQVVKNVADKKEKTAALALVNDTSHLAGSELWDFDTKTGLLSLTEAGALSLG